MCNESDAVCWFIQNHINYEKKTLPLSLFKSCWGSRGCVALMSYYAYWQRRGCGSGSSVQMATDPYQWPVWPRGGGWGAEVSLSFTTMKSAVCPTGAQVSCLLKRGLQLWDSRLWFLFLYLSVLHSFMLNSLLIVMNYFALICYGVCRLLLKIYCL